MHPSLLYLFTIILRYKKKLQFSFQLFRIASADISHWLRPFGIEILENILRVCFHFQGKFEKLERL